MLLGLSAPVLLLATPLRRKYWYADGEPIPYAYPLPNRPRDQSLAGYDDA
ncbi:hypothetical protein JNB11_01135 [Kocuria palustris]|nr:hypothetical protein [Kocuria palustris]